MQVVRSQQKDPAVRKLLQSEQLILPGGVAAGGDDDVVPARFAVAAGTLQGEGEAFQSALGDTSQKLHHPVKVAAAKPLLDVGVEAGGAGGDGVGKKAVLDVLGLQLLTDRACDGAAFLQLVVLLKDVEHRLYIEEDGDRQVDGVVVVFDHHPAQAGALGPADVAHRFSAGVVGEADGQHRVLKDEAVDRDVADHAAQQHVKGRGGGAPRHDDHLFEKRESAVVVLQSQQVAAVYPAAQKQVATTLGKLGLQCAGQALARHQVKGGGQLAAGQLLIGAGVGADIDVGVDCSGGKALLLAGNLDAAREIFDHADIGDKPELVVFDRRPNGKLLVRFQQGLGRSNVIGDAVQTVADGPSLHQKQN